MKIKELIKLIEQWAIDRGLDKNGTVEGQLIKTAEEVAELIIGISKDDIDVIKDSIGDVFVTLVIGNLISEEKKDLEQIMIDLYEFRKVPYLDSKFEAIKLLMFDYSDLMTAKNYNSWLHAKVNTIIMVAELYNLDFVDCVESAYKEIAYRKGRVIDGTFVKEDDLI